MVIEIEQEMAGGGFFSIYLFLIRLEKKVLLYNELDMMNKNFE